MRTKRIWTTSNDFPFRVTMGRCEKGIPYVSLDTLLELKLACAMTTTHRPRDLDDVIQLIKINRLPVDHADRLNPYVGETFRELWRSAQIDEEY